MCAGAIVNSRIKRVVYGARDAKAGCCGSLTDLFALPFNHHPVIESGLLEEEAQALLQDFFAMMREKRKKKMYIRPVLKLVTIQIMKSILHVVLQIAQHFWEKWMIRDILHIQAGTRQTFFGLHRDM